MSTISEIWSNDKTAFQKKTLSQILSFAGDGKLKDNSITSVEFRDLLQQIPSEMLKRFIDDCLTDTFADGGYALQDIVNQIGCRLDFDIQYGRYRGVKGDIGFDGIWSKDGFSIVVEVKTTDTYRIQLETIAKYRERLIEEQKIDKEHSSILIVVGRNDTKELEAQIRGSRYAWDIRVISTDSLFKLLSIKEALNDPSVMVQINEVLKPIEYTRLDELIKLMFITSQDGQTIEDADTAEHYDKDTENEYLKRNFHSKTESPANFSEDCIEKIERKLGVHLIKQGRIAFSNEDKSIGIVCATSKKYKRGKNQSYWFSFHPHQQAFLDRFKEAYVAYGCGSEDTVLLIPISDFRSLVRNMSTTERNGRKFWHVIVSENKNELFLYQKNSKKAEVGKYRI